MLKRKLMGLGLCVYMVATTCVGVLAVTSFTKTENCYNKAYVYSLTGNYNDTMIASSGGSTAYTVVQNTGTATRYMYCAVYEVTGSTRVISTSSSVEGAVKGGSTLQCSEISRSKMATGYKYRHTATVCGGATASTPELDYFKIEITQEK